MTDTSAEPRIRYKFTKSPLYRDIHIDGIWGGVHPGGYIQMAVFKDRSHLPNVVEYEVSEDGRLGNEISRNLPDDITREIEVDIAMNLNVATLMRDWLSERIDELTPLASESDGKSGDDSTGS